MADSPILEVRCEVSEVTDQWFTLVSALDGTEYVFPRPVNEETRKPADEAPPVGTTIWLRLHTGPSWPDALPGDFQAEQAGA